MTLAAAISALRHDSTVWDQVANATGQAGQQAAALELSERELSWAALPTGLSATYAEIQQKVVTLLGEATEVYTDLSTALDQVATAYELSDDKAAARFKGVWDVRE